MPWQTIVRLKVNFLQRNKLYRIKMPAMGPILKVDKTGMGMSWNGEVTLVKIIWKINFLTKEGDRHITSYWEVKVP
jgi:hypothetical protein